MLHWLFGRQKALSARSDRFGPHTVRRTIHDGEKAVVYEAVSKRTGEIVAIKAYKQLYNRTARRMRRKYRLPTEGEIGLQLNPGPQDEPASYPIVRTVAHGHEYGKSANPVFVVLEHVGGPKLPSLIATRDANLRARRLHFCRRATRALEIIHSRDMVHRDVCSDNFLFDTQWNVKLIDMGFCVPVGLCFEEKTGTPSYMAPEQIRAEGLLPQTDVYSLGVVMYELFVGRLPFISGIKGRGGHVQRGRAAEVMTQHLRDRPPKPTELAPDLAADIERTILKCLEKRPQDRFHTASELSHALGLLRE